MVYNTNRKKGAKFEQPTHFMLRRRAREAQRGSLPPAVAQAAKDARLGGARYALPGERPPSRYAPGQPDQTIRRFDAYMKAMQGTEVPFHAR